MRRFRKPNAIWAIAGLCAAAMVPMTSASAADVTVVGWGGSYQDSQRKSYFEPFAKETGINVREDSWSGEIAKIRAMVETNSVTWDVVDVESRAAVEGCAEGIFEPIDWEKLGIDRSNILTADQYECAVPTIFYSAIIAYDRDKLSDGPATIADLFDIEKFPGKRGLQKNPFMNLEWALVADGVAAQDVYDVLRTPEGIDRAFKKLDTIKNDVIWWEASAQPPQLLASGEVKMTSAFNGRITDANKNEGKNFGIVWDAQGLDSDLWVIPKGTPHIEEAYKFITFASSPEPQAEQTRHISYGPANKEAAALVDQALMSDLPTAPEHMTNVILADAEFWGEMGDQLRARFTAWLAQ